MFNRERKAEERSILPPLPVLLNSEPTRQAISVFVPSVFPVCANKLNSAGFQNVFPWVMSGLYPFELFATVNSWRLGGPRLFSFHLERAKLGLNALQDNEQSGVEIQDEMTQALPNKMGYLAQAQGPPTSQQTEEHNAWLSGSPDSKENEKKISEYESMLSL